MEGFEPSSAYRNLDRELDRVREQIERDLAVAPSYAFFFPCPPPLLLAALHFEHELTWPASRIQSARGSTRK